MTIEEFPLTGAGAIHALRELDIEDRGLPIESLLAEAALISSIEIVILEGGGNIFTASLHFLDISGILGHFTSLLLKYQFLK